MPGVNLLLQILILADDLSGAADCGVACVDAGLDTVVALRQTDYTPGADVLSLDADTRRMPANEAALEVDRLMDAYASDSGLFIFKKIDSTLRGNLAEELAAALQKVRRRHAQSSRTVAIMAPAFPAIGRTTRGGTQFVHEQPLHELDIWRLQGIAGRACIPEMLESAGLKCVVLMLDAIRSGREWLAEQMNAAALRADVLVCDAEKDEDLLAIASASMQLATRPIWVGSAGLAYQLPRAAGIARSAGAAPISLPKISEPLLFVIGSLSRNSLEQVRMLASSGTAKVCMPLDVLLAGEQHSEWHIYLRELEEALKAGRDVVLCPDTEPRIELAQRPRITVGLARMASSRRGQFGALVASGGETARAVFDSLGITQLRLLGELERGIPISITENWRQPLPVITKAGDFGGPGVLLKCSQVLHADKPRIVSPCASGEVVQ